MFIIILQLSTCLSKNSEFNCGDLFTLKKFVKDRLNLSGKWISLSGDVKQFSCESVTIKWYQGEKF